MKKLLSAAVALVFAASLAQGATPKAAEDANSPVTSVDQPAPRVKRAPAPEAKRAAPTAKSPGARAAKKGARHQAHKATPKKRARAGKPTPARHLSHHASHR